MQADADWPKSDRGRSQPPQGNNEGGSEGVARLQIDAPSPVYRRNVYGPYGTGPWLIDPPSGSNSWRLGARVSRAPKGLRIYAVRSYSPAGRAGLEINDYILDAGGYVVGEYEGQFYPLEQALQFGTGPDGLVDLLVWNKRTFAEEVIWVRLW